jgi:hypothetical protein
MGFAGYSAFSGWPAGNKLYLSTTAGGVVPTQPSGTDNVIQVLGYAMSATVMYFNPSSDQITHT